jgi:predicted kinase
MRKWMRERMRRRKKSSTDNLSESTGKVGQTIDRSKPAPIVPAYVDDQDDVEPSANDGAAETPSDTHHGRMEVETQPESPTAPPAAPDAATRAAQPQKRQPKGVVVLTIGLPGSGKTTWYKRRGVTPLSSDMLRTILFDSITEQRYQGLVFSTLRSLLRARLIAKMPWNYVDATNLSPHERRQWIKMARGFGYEVHAVFFDVPLETCLERNRRRERQVPEEVMHQMAQKLKPPTFKEGFSKIIVVRVKQDRTGSHEDDGA